MDLRALKIKNLRRNSVVFFGQTWFAKHLHSKSVDGSQEEFLRHFHKGVVKSVPSRLKNSKGLHKNSYSIYFEAFEQTYSFKPADLLNEENYYLNKKDLPDSTVMVKKEMDEAELFLTLSTFSEVQQVEAESLEELKIFKRKFLEAGIRPRKYEEEDMEELCDRGSKFFFCRDEDERLTRHRDTPQPLILIPLEENRDFFLRVFENDNTFVQQHINDWEPTRAQLKALMSVESIVLDSCALLNGVYCYIGGKIQSLMTNRKSYPAGQKCEK